MKDTVNSVGDADTLARKAANTFTSVSKYAQFGGDLTVYEWVVYCRKRVA